MIIQYSEVYQGGENNKLQIRMSTKYILPLNKKLRVETTKNPQRPSVRRTLGRTDSQKGLELGINVP